jgi:endoglucanase
VTRQTRGFRIMIMLALAAATLLASFAVAAPTPEQARAKASLRLWWVRYKARFILRDGRVQRPEQGNDTVSEGQAYAMIYAALQDDRETFDLVWKWTQKNLSRRDKEKDRLFAWHWKSGKVADWNSASDATLDMILALLIGHEKWKDDALKKEALLIAKDLLAKETAVLDSGRVLLPGTWGKLDDGKVVLNPSYYSPATFRKLHKITGDVKWKKLAERGYSLWEKSGRRLSRSRGVGLPPDWCVMAKGGRIEYAPKRSADYGWDALRIPMRAGIDTLHTKNVRGRGYLRATLLPFFREDVEGARKHPAAVYAYWGVAADPSESLAMTSMAVFAYQAAATPVPKTLLATFDRQCAAPAFEKNYYHQSMAFYPLACGAGLLGK